MNFDQIKQELIERAGQLDDSRKILKDPAFTELFQKLTSLPPEERAEFGKKINDLKNQLTEKFSKAATSSSEKTKIDVTAPFDVNIKPQYKRYTLKAGSGSIHPISTEIKRISEIFLRMGFDVELSRELDDDYHMFESLNFPEGHPARDDWDTFITDEGLVAAAHTSTMQNRLLKKYSTDLLEGTPIAVVVPDRVFRNEDLDATHEHTFHQVEGIFVSNDASVGNLIAVLKTYMSEFFDEELDLKIQPFYFPFTEPSFEFAVSRPSALRKDDSEAEQWLELGGCGMIHPNVLEMAGIDHKKFSGFAWGFGVERMIMMRHKIEDIRHFNSGKLEFLRQFK